MIEEKGKSVCAVVVTYNRKELVKMCLKALLDISYEGLNILVVDNNSSDGTQKEIQNFIDNKKVFYVNTLKNLGGAGGFNFGMKWALEKNYDYIWLMDDDTIVGSTSLKYLLEFAENVGDNFGFLSSRVNYIDGSLCKMNKQRVGLKEDLKDYDKDDKILLASFVSLFLKREVVLKMGLPIKDFFIWGDDWEYTYRLRGYNNYYVSKSVVEHRTKNNFGVDIVNDNSDRLDRYFYAYRNEKYMYKKMGFKGKLYFFLKVLYHKFKILFSKSKNKKEKFKIMKKGLKAGKTFNPPIEYFYSKDNKLKVLEFFAEPLSYGGQEAFMINMYRNFTSDKISYTLATPFEYENKNLMTISQNRQEEVLHFDKNFNSKNRKKYVVDTAKEILNKYKFDAIHIHSGSIFSLLNVAKIAKKAGVKKVIVHSHCAGKNNLKYKIIKFIADRSFEKYADIYLACSKLAAQWKFPKKVIDENRFEVIKNGVNIEKFTFDEKTREEYRKNLGLKDKFTLCHVGRFSEEKNHKFLFDVLNALSDKNFDFKCVLVGEGELKEEFLKRAKESKYFDKIIFLGKRDDVEKVLCACDMFLFPSIYEGLGIVAIEAQASGLKILCSEYIPQEAFLTDLACKVNLEKELWVEEIEKASKEEKRDRKLYAKAVREKGYDEKLSAKRLEEIYLGVENGEKN